MFFFLLEREIQGAVQFQNCNALEPEKLSSSLYLAFPFKWKHQNAWNENHQRKLQSIKSASISTYTIHLTLTYSLGIIYVWRLVTTNFPSARTYRLTTDIAYPQYCICIQCTRCALGQRKQKKTEFRLTRMSTDDERK